VGDNMYIFKVNKTIGISVSKILKHILSTIADEIILAKPNVKVVAKIELGCGLSAILTYLGDANALLFGNVLSLCIQGVNKHSVGVVQNIGVRPPTYNGYNDDIRFVWVLNDPNTLNDIIGYLNTTNIMPCDILIGE